MGCDGAAACDILGADVAASPWRGGSAGNGDVGAWWEGGHIGRLVDHGWHRHEDLHCSNRPLIQALLPIVDIYFDE